MSLLFTHPLFLAALAGLGIPLVLHLLLKQKSPRLRFSTVRFFQKQDPQAAAKRRLRNLLLLLMRLLVFTLLVLGFARPYLPWSASAGPPVRRQQVIVILDRSASLQANDGTGSRWSAAKKAARELLGTLREDDRAALITCGPRSGVAAGWGVPSVAVRVLEDISAGTGGADLAAGLNEALRLATTGDPQLATTLAVISDFQRTSALNLANVRLPAGVDVKLLPIGELAAPNLAVTELQLESTEDQLPHTTVVHYGDETVRGLPVDWKVDGRSLPATQVTLAPGESTNVPLVLPPLKPGWHDAEVRVAGRDALAPDDVRYAAFFVPEPLRVLLVEGRGGRRSFEEQTFFIAAALDPSYGTTNASTSRFALQKCLPQDLARALSQSSADPNTGSKTPARPELVVLPVQRSLSTETMRALTDFVRGGGSLMLWLDDGLVVGRYNLDFAELSPATLRTMESAEDTSGWHMGEFDKSAAIFAAFRRTESGNLALPGFLRRYSLTLGTGTRVPARFEDGVPLLLEREVGRGRVLLVNTSADTAWSDWPKRKSFVPWLHETVAYLAGRSGASVVAKETDDFDLGRRVGKTALQMTAPGKRPVSVTTDDQGHLALEEDVPGVYRLHDMTGREVYAFARNVPVAESDLAALRPAEFQQQLARTDATPIAPLGIGLFESSRNQREWWRVMLLFALALLVAESVFANRSYA